MDQKIVAFSAKESLISNTSEFAYFKPASESEVGTQDDVISTFVPGPGKPTASS